VEVVAKELSRPRVSIGLPVYNGERFLRDALDSLLSQSFEDFELLIADNASTDGTEEICRSYAAGDPRIRYIRNRVSYGAIANFNTVFRLTTGRYFKWAAYDDVCAPEFLARCVGVLDDDPSVVLACSRFAGIDEDGRRIALRSATGPGQVKVTDCHLGIDASVSTAAVDPTKRWRFMMDNVDATPVRVDPCGRPGADQAPSRALHGRSHPFGRVGSPRPLLRGAGGAPPLEGAPREDVPSAEPAAQARGCAARSRQKRMALSVPTDPRISRAFPSPRGKRAPGPADDTPASGLQLGASQSKRSVDRRERLLLVSEGCQGRTGLTQSAL
jgi:hypothetical protein